MRLDVSVLRHAIHPLWPIFDLTSPLVGLDHDTRAFVQWRIEGRGTGGPGPPLFLDQTEAQRAEIIFFETVPPLSQSLDDWVPH